MCGIIGYVGKDEAKEVLISGLKTLEYRGYDSAGLAVFGEEIVCVKAKGKIEKVSGKRTFWEKWNRTYKMGNPRRTR